MKITLVCVCIWVGWWAHVVLQVTRAAEECASTLANSIPPEQSVRVLIPIIQTAEFPVNLAAIKMQTKVSVYISTWNQLGKSVQINTNTDY